MDVINNRLKVDIYPYYLYNDSKACILCFYFYVGLYENYLDIKLRDPNMEIVSLCIGKLLHTHRITIAATVCVKKTATSFVIKWHMKYNFIFLCTSATVLLMQYYFVSDEKNWQLYW